MRTFSMLVVAVALSALTGCSQDLQKALEQAVANKDAKAVEALLERGADPFAPRDGRPSIFQDALCAAMDDNVINGADGLKNPVYSALCRKRRSKYPLVDATQTFQVGVEWRGFSESGVGQLVSHVTTAYDGNNVEVAFARDETEFRAMAIENNGYAIGIAGGPHKLRGRLIDKTIEAEYVEYLGPGGESGMLVPIKRYLPSTAQLQIASLAEYLAWKAKMLPDQTGRPAGDAPVKP